MEKTSQTPLNPTKANGRRIDMEPEISVLGVHPVEASEPCHLIEISVTDPVGRFHWNDVTQEYPDQPRSNWQTAYDEQVLEETSDQARYVFFFHYLDFSRPLITSFGEIQLPEPTPLPTHLRNIDYHPPD
jgi:hypothetical protein